MDSGLADLRGRLFGTAAPVGALDVPAMVRDEAIRQDVPPDLALAVARTESSLDPNTPPSPKGAIGVMQLMPGTAKDLGVDPYDPAQNIAGGVTYLKRQLDTFGDPKLALAAYNAGPGAVEKYRGVPPYAETQDYVAKALPPSAAPTAAPIDDLRARLFGEGPSPRPTPGPPLSTSPLAEAGRQAMSTGQFLRENAGELGGGALGGLVGGPPLAIAGGVGGRALQTRYETGQWPSRGELVGAAARGVFGEGTGALLGRLAQPAGTRAAERAAENAPVFARTGVPATVADLTQGRFARVLERTAESGMEDFSRVKTAAYESAQQRLASGLGPEQGAQELGTLAQQSVETVRHALGDAAEAAYTRASTLAGETGLMVPTGPLKAAAKGIEVQERLAFLPPVRPRTLASGAQVVAEPSELASKEAYRLARRIRRLPDEIPFAEARELQKRLGANIPDASGIPTGQAKQLFRGVSGSIDEAGAGVGKDAVAALDEGRKLTRLQYQLLADAKTGKATPLGDIVGAKDAAQLPDKLLNRTQLSTVRELRGILPASDWALFERHGVERLFEKARTPEKLGDVLNGLGDEFLTSYFSPSTLSALRDLADVAQKGRLDRATRLSAAPLSGAQALTPRQMVVGSLGGFGGFLVAGTPGAAVGAAGTTLAPPVIAKLITTKPGAYYFSQGLRLPVGSRDAASTAARLVMLAHGQDPEQRAPAPRPNPRPTP